MPRRLNRKGYGWSYTWGRGQRTVSDAYKDNFDQIKWDDIDTSEWPTRKGVFGVARVKMY